MKETTMTGAANRTDSYASHLTDEQIRNEIGEARAQLVGELPDSVRDVVSARLGVMLDEQRARKVRHETYADQRRASDDGMDYEFRGRCSCGSAGVWSRSIPAAHHWRDRHEADHS